MGAISFLKLFQTTPVYNINSYIEFNSALIEYIDGKCAENAITAFNGFILHNRQLSVKYHDKEANDNIIADPDDKFWNIFVGDLGVEIDNERLASAFSSYSSLIEARVMWDLHTGRSKGYGFVAFSSESEANEALASMNGFQLGSRRIRLHWAIQKNNRVATTSKLVAPYAPQMFQNVFDSAEYTNTTVYIGNLSSETLFAHLLSIFQQFGQVFDLKYLNNRGFAFAKMDTHEAATKAIVSLHGKYINGVIVRCYWAKERAPSFNSSPNLGFYPEQYVTDQFSAITNDVLTINQTF